MALDVSVSNPATWAEAGYEFELVIEGTYEPTGAFIKVRGEESKIAKQYLRKKFLEYQRKEQAKTRNKNKVSEELRTLEEFDEENVELAISRTISWRGITENGVDVPFTPENAERIYSTYDWIYKAVIKESNELTNFRPK